MKNIKPFGPSIGKGKLSRKFINIINTYIDKSIITKKNDYSSKLTSQIKNELKRLTNNAFEKDVFGAPTFIVNNKIFWGQDRLDYALDEYNS